MWLRMKPEEHAAAAVALFEAERSGQQIGILSQKYPNLTLEDAYAVQTAFVGLKQAAGAAQIGWKIGLTSRAMQQALNITTPDSGVLFNDMVFQNGATVPARRFIQPRIEAEIAFVLKDVLEGDVTRDDVIQATEYVVPALEILDTRIMRIDATGGGRKVTDTIADNAANAGIVVGDQRFAPDIDLRWIGAILSRDDVVEETGLGAGVLNDPAMGIVWLARRLANFGGRLEPGQTVLSGSFVRPVECPPGTKINADFGPFGVINIRFN